MPTLANDIGAPLLNIDPVPGRLIVIEGADGSGKTTLAGRVGEELTVRGIEVVTPREPGSTPLGERLRAMLKGEDPVAISPRAEALMFAAARAQLADELLRPALARGAWVVLDRFYGSSLVYQGHARALGVEEVGALSSFALGGLTADLTIVLTVSATAQTIRRDRRGTSDGDRFETAGDRFLDTVTDGYARLPQWLPDSHVIDADGTRDAVFAAAWPLVRALHDDG